MMFVAVDKKKVFSVKEEVEKGYLLSGPFCDFIVPHERCTFLDGEYVIILNLYGFAEANKYAKEKGYIE